MAEMEKMVKAVVNVDMDEKAVVELDKKGTKLVFEYEFSKFLKLSDEATRAMSADNRARYFQAKELWEETKDAEYDGIVGKDAQNWGVAASRKLMVQGNPRYKYDFVRPDEIEDKIAGGWSVTSGGVKTFRGMEKGKVTLQRNGREELVLVQMDKGKYDAAMKARDSAIEGWTNGKLDQDFKRSLTNEFEVPTLDGANGKMGPIAKE
jgi:hypothetical protein